MNDVSTIALVSSSLISRKSSNIPSSNSLERPSCRISSVRIVEDFGYLSSQLGQHDGGTFNREVGDGRVRVTILKSGIAYIEETRETKAMAASV